jgi:hypothetical protein
LSRRDTYTTGIAPYKPLDMAAVSRCAWTDHAVFVGLEEFFRA